MNDTERVLRQSGHAACFAMIEIMIMVTVMRNAREISTLSWLCFEVSPTLLHRNCRLLLLLDQDDVSGCRV
jgi:hypothetical protein